MKLNLAMWEIEKNLVQDRVSLIEQSSDAEAALGWVEAAKRDLRSALLSASWARLLPILTEISGTGATPDGSIRASGDGDDMVAIFMNDDGKPEFHLELQKKPLRPGAEISAYRTITLRGFDDKGALKESVIASGRHWEVGPDRGLSASGSPTLRPFPRVRNAPREVEVMADLDGDLATTGWFKFSELVTKRVALPELEGKVTLFDAAGQTEAAFTLIALDGGLAGARCLKILEEQERRLSEAAARRFGHEIHPVSNEAHQDEESGRSVRKLRGLGPSGDCAASSEGIPAIPSL